MPNTQTVAAVDFDAMTADDRWLGFGYLGARRRALDTSDPDCPAQPEMVEEADRYMSQWADAHRWSDADLFTWSNSKNGRWYGDAMFGGVGTVDERFAMAIRWGACSKARP